MRKAWSVLVVIALVVSAVIWSLRGEGPPPAQPDAAIPAGGSGAPGAAPADAVGVRERQAEPASPERVAAPALAAERLPVTVRGRCVDAGSKPIAGVAVNLFGWAGREDRLAEWRKQNGEPARVDESTTTGADGRFELRCWPPPPFMFVLRLADAGVAAFDFEWSELLAGETKDLGDVALERGTLLRGRVVEASGAPVGRVEVRIDAAVRQAGRGGYLDWCTARTGDDGTFAARWPLRAGEYRCGIDGREIERTAQVTLAGDGGEQQVEIVLRTLDDAQAITGLVVDQDGTPVRSAMILPPTSGRGRIITSDRDGRFRVPKPAENAPAKVALRVQRDGYEQLRADEQFEWGRTDVRLVLKKGAGLEVLVVRKDTGAPVENYVLRVMSDGMGGFHSNDLRPRGTSQHPGGRATVPGLRYGRYQVVVEPVGEGLAIGIVPLEMTSAWMPQVTVSLAATASRTVRVQTADGTPVPGAKVQAVDAMGQAFSERLWVHRLGEMSFSSGPKAIEIAAGVTDDRGEVVLGLPSDRPLGLNLPGPKHEPLMLPVATFPADAPCVVTVRAGARLQVTVAPESAVAELRRLAGIPGGATAEDLRSNLPRVELRSLDGRNKAYPDFRNAITMQPDGTFLVEGVPAGRWSVLLQCQSLGAEGRRSWFEETAGTVELVDGQTTPLTVDLTRLLPGDLEGTVLHNGAPLANTEISLQTSSGTDERGNARWSIALARTDADGRFRASVRSGEHHVAWNRQLGESWLSLQSEERARVTVGEVAQRTFMLRSGALRVRLLDALGTPVPGVAVHLRSAVEERSRNLPPTDAQGVVQQECPVETFTARVLPKRLQAPEAVRALYAANGGSGDPLASQWLDLGIVTTRVGETVEVELRLPEAFDR